MEVAEKEVDSVIESLSNRVKIDATNYLKMIDNDRHIKLKWILTHK